MSAVSEIYDAMIAKINTELPAYKQLPDPYDPEANNNLYLTKGFGLAIGGADNTERFVSCKQSILREFIVIMTKRINVTDHATTKRDTLVKDLLEDQITLIKAIEADSDLGGSCVKATFISDGGIEIFESPDAKARYAVITSSYDIEYLEDLT